MALLRGSWVVIEFPRTSLNSKADCTYLPEIADLKRIGTSDMWHQIVGNDNRIFAANRLLVLFLMCDILGAKIPEARRICSP